MYAGVVSRLLKAATVMAGSGQRSLCSIIEKVAVHEKGIKSFMPDTAVPQLLRLLDNHSSGESVQDQAAATLELVCISDATALSLLMQQPGACSPNVESLCIRFALQPWW